MSTAQKCERCREYNAERWLRNNADIYTRMGSPQIAQNMVLCADEIKKLRMAVDLGEQGAELMREEVTKVKAELAALKDAARTLISDIDNHMYCESVDDSKDELAALVGEE